MNNRILVLLIVLFVNLSNAQDVQKEYYDTGELKIIRSIEESHIEYIGYYKNSNIAVKGALRATYSLVSKNWEKDGIWEYYYENGKIKESGRFKGPLSDEKKHLEWKFYNEDGILTHIVNFEEGVQNGWFKKYYDNGQIMVESYYGEGVRDGYYKEYYDNGQIKFGGYFKEGIEDGDFVFYYEDGQIRTIINYINGNIEGEMRFYYEDGKLFSLREYVDGKLMNVQKLLDKNGDNLDFGSLKDGNGTLNIYDYEGNLVDTLKIVNGIEQK